MENKEFIVGQWYLLSSGTCSIAKNDIWYVKFICFEDNRVQGEYINLPREYGKKGSFGKIGEYLFKSVSINEVSEYLPEGHPDKILPELLIQIL